MAGFDVQGARSAGYSDAEIAQFLAPSNPGFDTAGALKAGYSPTEVVDHLSGAATPAPTTGGDAAGIAKSVGTGAILGVPEILGMPVALFNAAHKAYAGYNKTPYNPETDAVKTGSQDYFQKVLEKSGIPLHTPNGPVEEAAQTAGKWLLALAGGPEGVVAKLGTRIVAPYGASKLAQAATEGTPYEDLATLGAGLATGAAGMKVARGRAIAAAENAPVTSKQMIADGAHPDQIAQVKAIEDIQRKAQFSKAPTNVSQNEKVGDLLADPEQRGQFSPASQEALQGVVDNSPSPQSPLNNKEWTGKEWISLAIPPLWPAVAGAKALNAWRRSSANKASTTALEQIKTNIAKEPPPQPQAPPGPTMPDPAQLKLQMGAFENQRKALADQQAAAQSQSTLQAQALLRKLAAQNPKPFQLTPEQDAMGLMASRNAADKLKAAQAKAAAASDPFAHYDAADAFNATMDRRNTAEQTRGAQDLMKSRADNATILAKAQAAQQQAEGVAQAQSEASNSPLIQDVGGLSQVSNPAAVKTMGQYVSGANVLKKLRAQPEEEAPVGPEAAPVAPPVIAKINKKNGAVKETQAPQPAPEPPDLPRADFAHLPPQAIADLVISRMKADGKTFRVSEATTHAAVVKRSTAQDRIAGDIHNAVPTEEYQNVLEHVKGADSKAAAAEVRDHYIKLHPEAADAIRLALSKDRMKLGWRK